VILIHYNTKTTQENGGGPQKGIEKGIEKTRMFVYNILTG
jgi:hypothetical protein